MEIDIDSMTYEELIELNCKIVERLKFLDLMNTHKEMMQFNPGDLVCFEPSGRGSNLVHWLSTTRKRLLLLLNPDKNGMFHLICLAK